MRVERVRELSTCLWLTCCVACAEDTGPFAGPATYLDAAQAVDAALDPAVGDAGELDAQSSEAGADASEAPDASSDGGAPRFASKPLANPPSYQGSLNDSVACNTSYKSAGFTPDGTQGARYPLFLYFVGTAFSSSDRSAQYDNQGALKVAEAMARRGFVALSVAYDNSVLGWLSPHKNQLACLFGQQNAQSLLAVACALPTVDCAQGIATWGHSQGGYMAAMAFNSDPRVRAAWATGYGGEGGATLSKHRLRIVNGEADSSGTAASLNASTGLSPAECSDPDQCLRSDGSGWVIVRKRDLAMPESSSADHCWFDRKSCSATEIVLEPNWIDPASSKPFALESNADWLARTARDDQLP